MTIPDDVRGYLERLVGRLSAALEGRLVGVYGLGGLALGGYRPGRSDLDVYAVVETTLDRDERLSIAALCSHRALPCPARRLELVVISAEAAARPGPAPLWELNLNTGPRDPDHVGLDPAREPSHWFVLDLAIAHQCGLALLGPPAREVIGPPEIACVWRAQAEAVAWYAHHERPADTVTAACRAWHWFETGSFAGKEDALRWAAARIDAERAEQPSADTGVVGDRDPGEAPSADPHAER